MDRQNLDFESRRNSSFSQLSGASSSRRHSLSVTLPQYDDSVESDAVSEAGDIGDRALPSNRISASGRSHFSSDNLAENGAVVPLQEDKISPHSVDAIIQSDGKKNDEKEVPWLLEHITCLFALADIGILGVLARYGLRKLFGPGVIGALTDQSYMHRDIPSNMVGSFLMGLLGVFKADILKFSDLLYIVLTTGFLGSLTTFSGWIQNILDLSVNGRWIFAMLDFFIGMLLVVCLVLFGIQTAKLMKWLYRRSNTSFFCGVTTCSCACFSNKYHCLLTFMTMLLLILVLLWSIFGSLAKKEFETGSSEAQLFIACMVGPLGVWIRWYLARFNGRALGKNGMLKWMPFGTLAANVLAACLVSALATLKIAVKTRDCDTVALGLQFGLPGCLSTVSTFIAEVHAMLISKHPWRAYVYVALTFTISFILGTLIYSVPIWVMGYD